MWILPTRGRPQNLIRFFERFAETGARSPGIVCVDNDDPQLERYKALARPDTARDLAPVPRNWKFVFAPRIGLGPTINRAFEERPDLAWYGMLSDDAVPTTPGWDRALIEAAGSDGVAYGADGIRDEASAGMPVLGGDFVRSLGWIILPGLVRLYGDDVWTEIARKRGVLRYLPHVRLEHWHFSNGKAPKDETYRKPEADADRRLYEQWRG